MGRVLFHIDLNAFFASAEVLRNCALDEQPLVVSGLSRRGVVCTASYKAREYGIHAAMPIQHALQLCPELVVVPTDLRGMKRVVNVFLNIFVSFHLMLNQQVLTNVMLMSLM